MLRVSIFLIALCCFAPLVFGQDVRTTRLGKQEVELTASPDLVVFGFRSRFNKERFLEELGNLIVGLKERFPGRRCAVLEVRPGSRDELVAVLRRRRDVRFAHPVYSIASEAGRKGWYLLTNQLVVKFAGAPTVNQIQRDLDRVEAQLMAPISWLPGAFLLRLPPGGDAMEVAKQLAALRSVTWAHPNWLRFLGERDDIIPNDPLFGNQWHLQNTGQGGGLVGADIKAPAAWDHATGAGMTIAVIDTGVQVAHPDLLQYSLGYDPLNGAGPTNAQDPVGHGTRCAGVAAAIGNNNNQVCGAAYEATILPISLLDGTGFGTPTDEAGCFIWATDNGADVITNSWGPDGIPFPLPTLVEQSFAYAVGVGRNGLGSPIFWAAGNGNEPIGPDEYVASVYTIAVGATDNFDLRSNYSDYGPELDFMAPSSGGTRSISTTDIGSSTTLNFGGTSSAAPLAAGVAALILEVAPDLNWVQVGDILRDSADKIQPAAANYNASGHSLLYGNGRLNAEQAVLDAIASQPAPLTLSITTTGVGDILVQIQNMAPFNVWVIGFSLQILSPIGSGPIYGVAPDALQTIFMPYGVIPFHSSADANGNFYWGATGLPAGLTLQAVAIEVPPDYNFRGSNVIQVTF